MPKFSDSPYFLLKDYLKEISESPVLNEETTTDQIINSYLRSGTNDIIATGGYYIELFIRDLEYGFRPIRLMPIFEDPIEKTYFRFTDYEFKKTIPNSDLNDYTTILGQEWICSIDDYTEFRACPGEGLTYSFKDWDTESKIVTDISNHTGQEIYFRKDSNFHEWLKDSAYSYYLDKWEQEFNIRNYVNTDKNFIYFGQIYPSRIQTYKDDTPLFHIVFEGIKDFVNKSIPTHQKTFRMLEYLEIYFDRIYNEIYNLQKNIYSLYDPLEIDERYLHYLSMMYNIDLDQNVLTSSKQREFIRDIIFLLERKGVYNCFHIIWKIISASIINPTILEKWHDEFLIGKIPDEEYVNIPYTDFYTKEVNTTGLALSTSYRVEFNLDNGPFTTTEIAPEYLCKSLYNYYELFRPVNRVSNYAFIISPITDITGEWKSLYENVDYYQHLLTRYTMTTTYNENSYIFIQWYESDTWIVNHTLNSTHILTQVIGLDLEKITPARVTYTTNSSIIVKFDHPVTGAVLLKKADWYKQSKEPAENWILKHDLNTQEALVQVKYNPSEDVSVSDWYLEETINEEDWLYNGSIYYINITHDLNHRYPFVTSWNTDTNMRESLYNIISINNNVIRLESEYAFNSKVIFFKDTTEDNNLDITNSDWLYNGNLYYKIINHSLDGPYLNTIFWNNDTNIVEKMAKITHIDNNTLIVSASTPINANVLLCKSKTSRTITNWIEDDGEYYTIVDYNMSRYPIITTWNLSTKEVEIYKDIEYIDDTKLKIYSINDDNIRINIDFISSYDIEGSEQKLYTSDIQLTNINELKIEDVDTKYTAMLLDPNYVIYFMTEATSIWDIDHGLNQRGVMAQFYDENNYKINPVDYKVISNNNVKATFEYALKGYAVLENVGHFFIMNDDLEFKAGTEENSMLEDGIAFTKDINNIYIENDIYYIEVTIPEGTEEYTIREMGIFEKSTGDMIIYTKCYDLFKHKNFKIEVTFRLSKNSLN